MSYDHGPLPLVQPDPPLRDEKKVEAGTVTPGDDDEDVREFEALIRDIAELRDADTIVEHMDVDIYRKGNRT